MSLPIDDILPALKAQLAAHPTVILQAPPGAGKTTCVPPALLTQDWLKGRKILMLEPRRLAATHAARFMAGQRNEKVGQTIGYSIRYQQQVSPATRIEVITEGILLRRLQNDPELGEIGLIIFDEFHERRLDSDLSLALCHDIQQGLREDLKLLIMSATLDGAPLSNLLDAPLLSCDGRQHPITINYLDQEHLNLVDSTVTAVHRALRETTGDVLVFLPGAAEIHRCRKALTPAGDIDIRTLYGGLSYDDQQAALRPGEKRKVVLATNIAETSLTIDGIRVVVDSGYSRQPRFDPASGFNRLKTLPISQASATQRAGRSGRQDPGSCYRLWSKGTQGSLLPHTPAEIRNADLAPLVLQLAGWGIHHPEQLIWLDPPTTGALQAGRILLMRLQGLDANGQLTRFGKHLLSLPIHPRLGRMLLKADELDGLAIACDLAALLTEPWPWKTTGQDLTRRLETLVQQRHQGPSRELWAIEKASSFWRRHFHVPKPIEGELNQLMPMTGRLLACAYPDRIARRREGRTHHYLLASGQGVRLSQDSHHAGQEFLVVTSLQDSKYDEAVITEATPLGVDDITELYPHRPWIRSVRWDNRTGRVVAREEQLIDRIPLATRPAAATQSETESIITALLQEKGLGLLNWTEAVESYRARIELLRQTFPEQKWPELSDAKLLEDIDFWLRPYLGEVRSRDDLSRIDLTTALGTFCDWRQRQSLKALAPERFQVASGSRIRINYVLNARPVLAVKLQEMFGTTDTPRIAAGRVPLVLHLLSPAGHPLQLTQDLGTFWDNVYPEVKKEMQGRYPKHPWPDDPWSAVPTRHTKRNAWRF